MLIINAKIVTAGENGIIESGSLLIKGSKISQVSSGKTVGSGPDRISGLKVVDAEGAVITPGLFDSGTILALTEVEGGTRGTDFKADKTDFGAAFKVGMAVNRHSSMIPMVRASGVTSVIVRPSAGSQNIAGQSAILSLAEHANLLNDGNAMFVDLRERSRVFSGGTRAIAMTKLEAALDEAMVYKKNKKAYRSGKLKQLALSELDLIALEPVIDGDKPIAVYVDRAADIEQVIKLLGNYQLILVGAREGWMVKELIAKHAIPVVLNVLDNIPSTFDQLGARLDNAALLASAGVTIAFMTEDIFTETKSLTQAAGVAVANGLPWDSAINAITVNPAEIWGSVVSGKLESGQIADLVMWDGDPLEVTSKPTRVMIHGEWVSLKSRQTLLRDRYADLSDKSSAFGYR